jgi:WD40 repeat protein
MVFRSIWRLSFALGVLLAGGVATARNGTSAEPKQAADDAENLPPRAVARLGSLAFCHRNAIAAVALNPDGTLAATAGETKRSIDDDGAVKRDFDRNIRLWSIPAGKPTRVLQSPDGPVMALAFAPDGKRLAAIVGNEVLIWDAATGKEIRRTMLGTVATLLRFTPDGKRLLTVDVRLQVRQWDLDKESHEVLWDGKAFDAKYLIHQFDLALDGSRLAMLLGTIPEADDKDVAPPHLVHVVQVPGGTEVFQAKADEFARAIALTPDGRQVVFGNERLAFWDLATKKKGRELERVPTSPLPPLPPDAKLPKDAKPWRSASSLSFSPSGDLLATTYGFGDVPSTPRSFP